MRVVQILANERFSDYDVSAVYEDDFCKSVGWDVTGIPRVFGDGLLMIVGDDVEVAAGYMYDGTSFIKSRDVHRAKILKIEQLAEDRWTNEERGIVFNGHRIDASKDTQAAISLLLQRALLQPSFHTVWKTRHGFLELPNHNIQALAMAISNHIEACFLQERRLIELVMKADTLEQIKAIRWTRIFSDIA